MRRNYPINLLFLVMTVSPIVAWGEEAVIAVATNFTEVLEILQVEFESGNEHELVIVSGSTGKLYAQIRHGAPFDAFLAADQERPRLLEETGDAISGTRITYAVGRLTLWSPDEGLIAPDGRETLRKGNYRRLAMANAALAPYGAAARETLDALGVYDQLQNRIITGENIGQAWAMVATGNAELGMVALSYVLSPRNQIMGSRWDVPQNLYAPIRQDAVLLRRARDNAAAAEFLRWIREPQARTIIEKHGYSVE